jgi:hypothetical protein
MIIIENPTNDPVDINRAEFVYENEFISIEPETLTIPAKAERGFEISYRPLIVSEETIELALNSEALGSYKYEVILRGIASTAQRSMHFK